ncbi:tetratricopeptide repeat protein [Cochlodiniinecator piscidefendens]|uniref:tetratricopeptide repeat protein n=1 Tax=Cochlodiniinecator piscidefendens TaxID=2715756 RepID=UPI00140DAB57|nr:hypothetical protein [Cochlodiniinecator piscidefendens]
MSILITRLKRIVTAAVVTVTFTLPLSAQDGALPQVEELGDLYALLATPGLENPEVVEQRIWQEWGRSGSAVMDLLWQRGDDALEAEDYNAALEHFTALTDHAPGFAAGWHGRAAAYFNLGYFGPAVSDLEVAIALNPNHFGALTGLGVLFEALGEEDAAFRAYEAAFALNPHDENVTAAIERLATAVSGRNI